MARSSFAARHRGASAFQASGKARVNVVPGTRDHTLPKGMKPELDNLLHDRLRLGIVSALAGTDVISFVELKALLDTTDGNLSVHARKLEDAGYVSCTKSFAERRPRSEYRLTALGRRSLQRYLDHMQAVIETTRRALKR